MRHAGFRTSDPAASRPRGPGASVVAFLAWIYFSSQILFLGAELTQVWSRRGGGVMSTGD